MHDASATAPLVSRRFRLQALIAFGLVYSVWGTTYLAIRVLVRTLPPLSVAGLRFVIGGGVPLGVLLARGAAWPSLRQWRSAAVAGCLMWLGANGLVCWAEQRVSSGLTALLVAVTPLWFAILDALRPGACRPQRRTLLGLPFGFAGVAYLVGPEHVRHELGSPPLIALLSLLASSVLWAAGSLYARHAERPASLWMTSAMQLLLGGLALLVAGALAGEPARLAHARLGLETFACLAYLIVAGTWLGFGSFVWLLHHVSAVRLSTYSYVNPLVAVLIGAWLLDEPLTPNLGWAALLILGSVAIVQFPRRPSG